MRTPEEVLLHSFYRRDDPEIDFNELEKMIKAAMNEVITEVGRKLKIKKKDQSNEWVGQYEEYFEVDLEPIINISKKINQIN